METTKNFDEFINERVDAVRAEAKKIAEQTMAAIKSSASAITVSHEYKEQWLFDAVMEMLTATHKASKSTKKK